MKGKTDLSDGKYLIWLYYFKYSQYLLSIRLQEFLAIISSVNGQIHCSTVSSHLLLKTLVTTSSF